MLKQRDAYKLILPELREHACKTFNIDKDLNFQETMTEYNNNVMKSLDNCCLPKEGKYEIRIHLT